MHSNKREERDSVSTGEIVAAVGLKNVKTGHTLCDEKNQVLLESMDFPEPVVAVSVSQLVKVIKILFQRVCRSWEKKIQPLRFLLMKRQAETIISGMGELAFRNPC